MALELDRRQRAMLQEMGVDVWLPTQPAVVQPAPAARAAAPVGPATGPAAPAAPLVARGAPAAPTPTPAPAPARPASMAAVPFEQVSDWPGLRDAVQACRACALCAGRSHATLQPPAPGMERCDWMVLGDPPDDAEDQAGAPFVGQEGVLLAAMLRALGLQRANPPAGAAPAPGTGPAPGPQQRAYVSNVLKCRPAHGAMAQAAELAQCSAWLQQEIALVQPKIMVSMGRFANQLLLGQHPELAALPLGKLRGTVYRYQGVAVVVSYPPKQLLRNSADKAKAWADLCLAAASLRP